MDMRVIEYKCPCCNAGLQFGDKTQQLTCEYCGNEFEIDTIKAFNESEAMKTEENLEWSSEEKQVWSETEQQVLHAFQCPSCGGEILTDETDAATFCPYCDNPTILPARLTGDVKPDGVIPFQTSKEDAQAAFLKLTKGKKLLPKFFTSRQRIEKITGMYVPFWLYECNADFNGSYKATRIRTWSDSNYTYTKTDHYMLTRQASAAFSGIPMDGSEKMDDALMESIEPYDYSKVVDFDMAYLTGYLADKYDIPSEKGEDRIRERVNASMNDALQNSLQGYHSVIPANRQLHIANNKAKYVLMPVWILNTNYNGKIYTFAMNGQTGKMVGTFPVCRKRMASWFVKICAGVTLVLYALQFLLI